MEVRAREQPVEATMGIGAAFVEAWAGMLAAEHGDASRPDAALEYLGRAAGHAVRPAVPGPGPGPGVADPRPSPDS